MIKQPLALYIHWPFCLSKCPYCDFNSHVRESVDFQSWQEAFLIDLRSWYPLTESFEVVSIFFGGGTPSLMPLGIVDALLSEIAKRCNLSTSVEITLEANPNSVEVEKFRSLREIGINRLSLGIQSLEEKNLKFLGRSHSKEEALKAIEVASRFFENRSFDLIYTLPKQSLKEWQQELNYALSLAGTHLSLYQLTIEEGTPFYLAAHRGDFCLPSSEESANFFEWTHAHMNLMGYPAYEVSNFSKPGYACLHNKHYWYYGDYVGIGPGAHSRLTIDGTKYALRRHRSPEKWLDMVKTQESGLHEQRAIQNETLIEEFLLMRIRLLEGFSEEEFFRGTGKNFYDVISKEKILHLVKEGLLHETDKIKPTLKGLMMLNGILEFLTKDLKRAAT